MISSHRLFIIEQGTLANLKRHIGARLAVVTWAKTANFKWGLDGVNNPFISDKDREKAKKFWTNIKTKLDTESDSDAIKEVMGSPGDYSPACYWATLFVYMRVAADYMDKESFDAVALLGGGVPALATDGYTRSDTIAQGTHLTDWIPGDWGYIKKEEHKRAGQEGENLIYMGNGKYWGHTYGGPKILDYDGWTKKVRRWSGGGSTSHGLRRYPRIGLEVK